jgi:hypothetical protein
MPESASQLALVEGGSIVDWRVPSAADGLEDQMGY